MLFVILGIVLLIFIFAPDLFEAIIYLLAALFAIGLIVLGISIM
jgi:hypothetical protein